ncbi:DoxX family protein [Corallococcus caeni]|uniref:DoxX family membrane protein n=1 Tax=Corallococcus exercitus TaxID=2316736 RepID=A0A7Y4JTC6_9BACT|nr:DoxX family protein [Corallococcus exercitus]NOK09887.1 DoxX family membrane protein [Corallococcus exercitus]GMU00166.1 DoxX family protein [Corallococcus sp. KH5-1]
MDVKTILQYVLALFMVAAGVNHFLKPRMYMRIMPPYLPRPRELVLVSGVAEVLLGIFLLVPATTRLAAWGLVALFVAVFPANLYMAWHPEQFRKIPPALLWLRLPLQAVLILWALWYA